MADALGKPIDQAVYLFASFISIACAFICKEIKHESTKRTFSIITGMAINFFVFGVGALSSVFQNLLSFVIMVLLPSKY